MDVGAASALALYNYQTTLNSYGQGANPTSSSGNAQNGVVLNALADTYSSLTNPSSGFLPAPDTLSALAGSSGVLGPLMSALYSESVAGGKTSFDLSGLTASAASVGGVDTTSAAILFASNSNKNSSGISSAAINLNASLALASYANYLQGVPSGTAQASATKGAANSAPSSDVQTAIQSAQSSAFASIMNLLA